MRVDVHSVAQISPMRMPAPLEIYGTADVDLAVLLAADLIDTR
jgi:hypothetical protein